MQLATTDEDQLRRELTQSLQERNNFSIGTEVRRHLTEVVDQIISDCSDAMILDIHREYFNSPVIAKRIYVGFREQLPAVQIHELAVLTSQIPAASNQQIIKHVKALLGYMGMGLTPSGNYALESETVQAQCRALLTVSNSLHGYKNNQYIIWIKTPPTQSGDAYSPILKDQELISYVLENPEQAPLIVEVITDRGDLDLDLIREMSSSALPLSEGTL